MSNRTAVHTRPRRVALVAGLAALALTASASAAGASQPFTAGSDGLGDPFFPQAGNDGYDVRNYSLDLNYDPATKVLSGTAKVKFTATQDLDQFNLDLREFLDVSRVKVDDVAATYSQQDVQELVVTPRSRLLAGRTYMARIDYAGTVENIVDPDDSIEGWVATSDGAFVVGEPQGAPGWFPSNDNPRDKATYDMAITVPKGNTVLGNGRLVNSVSKRGKTTWRWREDSPMATYLATATNGRFDLTMDATDDGKPIYNAVDSAFSAANKIAAEQRLAKQPAMIAFLEGIFGPYPFTTAGAIIDDARFVGYALESQTKPNYHRVPGESTILHELAHQWVGDSVSLSIWPDIWLNEGFAAWAEWRWSEFIGGDSAQAIFEETYDEIPAGDEFWDTPAGDPGSAANLFGDASYTRGAMTLQALRAKVGEAAFTRILHAWYAENRNGNVVTADFVAVAERESEQQLDEFFDTWLYTPGKPTSW